MSKLRPRLLMAMNGLQAIEQALIDGTDHEVFVDDELREKALILRRMLIFLSSLNYKLKGMLSCFGFIGT